MASFKIIDARGLSCPEPVLATKKAVEAGGGPWQVLVDNRTALQNVKRFAGYSGLKVSDAAQGEDFCITLSREG